jgi:hypothetical protein
VVRYRRCGVHRRGGHDRTPGYARQRPRLIVRGAVVLLVYRASRLLVACLPGAPRRAGLPRPEPGASAAGRGGAQRSRLDLVRLNSAALRPSGRAAERESRCDELREPNRRPLRPEANYKRGLPAPQHPWPGTDRPWVSAYVHCCPWRSSLTLSLGCSRAGRERLLPHTLSSLWGWVQRRPETFVTSGACPA